MWGILGVLFVFGLFVGSFINVLADRLSVGQSPWVGRSRCDFCKTTLQPLDLIPLLSFAYLRGRCRYCHKKLSMQYPVVELLTGCAFTLVGWYSLIESPFANSLTFVYLSLLLLFTSNVLALFVADYKYQILPDELLTSSAVVILFLNRLNSSSFSWIVEHVLSALVCAGVFLVLFLITRGKGMGFGDVKLAAVLGWWLGLPESLLGIYLSFLTGGMVAFILLLIGKKKLKQKIAFGPFLLIGSILVYTFGAKWFIELLL